MHATIPTGAITGHIRYTWQAEFVAGSGVFDDIILLPGGDLAFESASGVVFRVTPAVDGLSLRVKAIYTGCARRDGAGVLRADRSRGRGRGAAADDAGPVADAIAGGAGVNLVRSDLDFILKQIKIAEAHAAGTPLQDLIPNIRLAYGLRTVDGSENNLLNLGGINQTEFGAADTTFPRLLTRSSTRGRAAAVSSVPGPGGTRRRPITQTSGNVFDSAAAHRSPT